MIRRLLLSFLLSCYGAAACLAAADEAAPAARKCYVKLAKQKRDFYRKLYPDTLFVMLNGEDAAAEIVALSTLLGPEPVNLDYEHPEDLRQDLLDVSIERIWLMLQYQMPSASLYRADEPLGWQENICVITLDPCFYEGADATERMLDLPDDMLRRIPGDMRLGAEEYLEFSFDHEVYHCLQSLYLGPQKMSFKELWGEYNIYLNEKGADAYALAMHIRNHKGVTPFAARINRIRGLSIYTCDPNHFTCDALEQVLARSAQDILRLKDAEVFHYAATLKDELAVGYDEYLQYLAAAIEAQAILGVDTPDRDGLGEKLTDITPQPELVNRLVESSRIYLRELSGPPLRNGTR